MLLEQRKPVPARAGESRNTRPRAVTLMEVLLVLVVLTLIAATAWPALERSFANRRLRDAADLVRAELAAARSEAMRSGAAQQFHYTPEEQTYWVDRREDVSGALGGSTSPDANVPAEAGYGHSMLPDGIYFHEGETQKECSSDAATDQASQDGGVDPDKIKDAEAGAAIVFYADGSCSSARLVLRNEYDQGITIIIRGLTGMSDVREIFNIEDRSP